MANVYDTVWRNAPSPDWSPNGSAESGHNFTQQIGDQQQNIDKATGNYDQYKGVADNARNRYEDQFNNQTTYEDYYNRAKESEGVNDARAQYQRSLAAVNGVQSAMNALPSSVNATSARRLTQSQAQRATANQMGEYNSTLQYWQNKNAGDLSQYQMALGAAQNLAGQNLAQQQQNIQTALSNYHTTMSELNDMYNQIINERNILRTIYGQMYDDEYNHRAQELQAWATQVQAETERYVQAQENARNNASIAAQNKWLDYMNQSNNPTYKNWDFGNGYSVQETPSGEAAYYKNGQPISAGEFLTATGYGGGRGNTRWDLWNDIWNNGVSTAGVGSDTVDAFQWGGTAYKNSASPSGGAVASNQARDVYNYLFGR